MSRKSTAACCSSLTGSSCHVEAVVTVDERGQMVLPKDLRDRAGIKAGDKLAAVSYSTGDQVCCIALIRVEELTDLVTTRLGPVLRGVKSSPPAGKPAATR